MEIKYRRELPDLMRHLNLPMIAAELGVAEGYHSADLLKNGIKKLYMVDVWSTINVKGDGGFSREWHDKNFYEAMKRVEALKRNEPYDFKNEVLRGTTDLMALQVPENTLGLCYIDAAHDYKSVKNDIENYYPKLVIGGIMAFHDFETYSGVNQAVIEFATANNLEIHLLPEDKIEDAGAYFFKK